MPVAVVVDRNVAPRSREPDSHAREQNEITARAVRDALEELGHRVKRVEADGSLLISLRVLRPDLIFNLAAGGATKRFQAHIVAMLELSGAESGPVASRLVTRSPHQNGLKRCL